MTNTISSESSTSSTHSPSVTTTTTTVSSPITMATIDNESSKAYRARMETEHVLRAYNTRSKEQDSKNGSFYQDPRARSFNIAMRICRFIVYSQYIKPGSCVVDLACGRCGAFPSLLRLGVASYVGIDGAKSALEEGETRIEQIIKNPPSIPKWIQPNSMPEDISYVLRQINLNGYQKENRLKLDERTTVDVVLCENALHYFNALAVLQHIKQDLLKTHGYCIVLVPTWTEQSFANVQTSNPWFQIKTSADDNDLGYRVTVQGLVDNVWEQKLTDEDMKAVTNKQGLRIVETYTAYELYQKHAFSKSITDLMPWPQSIARYNLDLMSVYRFYILATK